MLQQEGRISSSTGWVTSHSWQPPHADPSPTVSPLSTGLAWRHCPHLTEQRGFTLSLSGSNNAVYMNRELYLAFILYIVLVKFSGESINDESILKCVLTVLMSFHLNNSPSILQLWRNTVVGDLCKEVFVVISEIRVTQACGLCNFYI